MSRADNEGQNAACGRKSRRACAYNAGPDGMLALMERDKPIGMTRLLRAFGYSFQGFMHAWREEAAFRQEAGLSALVIPLGAFLGRSGAERALPSSPWLSFLVAGVV